jgi:DNA primase large subunit
MGKPKNKEESVFEKELKIMIKETIEDTYPHLEAKEVKEIVDKLLPDIDTLVSKKVKQHLVELAKFIIKKFE